MDTQTQRPLILVKYYLVANVGVKMVTSVGMELVTSVGMELVQEG